VFSDQIELIREVVKEKYGIVQFSSVGKIIWWSVLANHLFWVILILGSAFSISRIYVKNITFTPSSTTKKYLVFIMVMMFFVIAGTILLQKDIGPTVNFRYEYIPHLVLIFLAHLWAFVTNRPKVVAFALWLVVVGLFANIIQWILGWSVKPNWIGISIGGILFAYTLVKSSSSSSTMDFSKKEQKNILLCDSCSFTCALEDFNNNQLFCPYCDSRLSIESE
jgi:hypothetical protein